MMHRTQTTTQFANTQTIKSFAESAILATTELKQFCGSTSKCLMKSGRTSIITISGFRLKMRSNLHCDEIAEFEPPKGTKLFHV